MLPRKRQPRPRMFDDSDFLIQREKPHESKPEARFRSEVHRAWIRKCPCEHCGRLGGAPGDDFVAVEAAHIRVGTKTGKGETPDDFWCWPGCVLCHENLQHKIGEWTFWQKRRKKMDPHRYILEMYALTSPCTRTQAAAREEHARRYPRAP
jgi:hypothetical protein